MADVADGRSRGRFSARSHHFVKFNPGKSAYAEERYRQRGEAALAGARPAAGEVDYRRRRLFDRRYRDLAVDLALRLADVDFADHPNVKRWYLAIAARPAVQRGFDVLHEGRAIPMP